MVNLGARLLAGVAVAALGTVPARAVDAVATIKPLHALVARVMAGAGTPHLLVQGALSPHTYALRPSDAARLHAAGIFFRMSDIMEPFTVRVVRALPRRVRVVTLEETPELRLLPRRSGATFAETDHGHGHGHNHKHGNGHGNRHGHAPMDGHAWLDPVNAKIMADRIAQALSVEEPAQAAAFRGNAARLKADLDALHAELAHELAPIAGKPFIVFHDALQYFERRYGLKAVGAIAISPEVPPGARRLSALRRQIIELGAECVFAEPQLDTRRVSAVVEGTGARVGSIDPEGSKIEPGPDHYVALLRALARDLKACLATAGQPRRAGSVRQPSGRGAR
jgi:zinc transport system substrate-binding protein